MERVLVTGGAGLLGRYVLDELEGKYHVLSYDLGPPGHPFAGRIGSILDLRALEAAMEGIDAVIHIAAAANIGAGAPSEIMDCNVRGTWNVLEAAFNADVRRVVLCSSDSVLGNTVFKEYFWLPRSLPVNEKHPVRPADPYGLSKYLGEEAGRSYAARGKLEVLALRPVFILFPSMLGEVRARHASPETYRGPSAGGHSPAGGGLCWHHIDPRDVARAFRLALESSYRSFDRFYLSAPSTLHPAPTLQLIEDFFGDSPRKIDRQRYTRLPYAPMFDTSHAEKYLGWNAAYDHRPALYGNGPFRV